MRSKATLPSMLVAAALVVVVGTPAAQAQLSDSQIKCFETIGKAGAKFVKGTLKIKQKCKHAGLKDGSCTTPDSEALQKEIDKLNKALDGKCVFNGKPDGQAANFANMGYPGPCTDADESDGFILEDLKTCIKVSHSAIVDEFMDMEYDSDVTGPLPSADLKCQETVGKASAKHVDCVLKAVQKCRNGILKGKIVGIVPDNCLTDDPDTSDPKTYSTHEKCITKMESSITGKCTDAQTTSLQLCMPDGVIANTAEASHCEHEMHMDRTDGPLIDVPADLIDFEYATRGGLCGDGVRNSLNEECDGSDDADCPGKCGSADGFFACLCKTNHRERVVEHFNADLDNGWSGRSHDSGIVEGGGYLADLYDCDGNGDCIVGPSCSDPPHSPCGVLAEAPSGTTGDSICVALGQGTCRKTRVAVGPHCYKDIQKKCNPKTANDPVCNAPGDFCVKQLHGPPLPLSSGGVSVCIVNQFSEDIVGTTNLITGTGAVRLRQNSITHSSAGSANAPCPVCGGFCQGDRERCSADADCAAGQGPCRLDLICSSGPNNDKPCRITPPFGGASAVFGSTSIDCPPFPGSDISSKGLDILFNPTTTGVTSWSPTYTCNAGKPFDGNVCFGGTSEGRPCTTASECPGGSCSPQCFCPSDIPAPAQKPNDCDPACLGGDYDGSPCAVDSECSAGGGFCHFADCRLDSSDTASCQEGTCTVGPAEGHCSVSIFQGCNGDDDCKSPACSFCQLGEKCAITPRPCFVNVNGGEGIKRCGVPGVPDRKTGALFCIPGSSGSSVNNVAGLPGPGAITNPVTVIECPGTNCDCPGGHCP